MPKKWKLIHRTLQLKSKWVTVYADKLIDDKGQELEYWHYDRPDSVVAIVIHRGSFLLPLPQYRVGVDLVMLDFAGSRIDNKKSPKENALTVVSRELDIQSDEISSVSLIKGSPFAVDSSFSSQKLWGFIVYINDNAHIPSMVKRYVKKDVQKLRKDLRCGQCRLLLDEHILQLKV
jgi:hypothetical protein